MEEVSSAKKIKVQPPIPQEVLQHNEEDELGDLPKDTKGDPIFPDLKRKDYIFQKRCCI